MRRTLPLLIIFVLAACAERAPAPAVDDTGRRQALAPLPSFPVLGAALPAGNTRYGNDSLARLFVTLAGEFEWDVQRPNLVRFEQPIRVRLEGPGAQAFESFLTRYLAQMRREAGVDIHPAEAGEAANLHVRIIDGRSFGRTVHGAACITTVGDIPWARFAADPERYGARALAAATRLEAATVFIPDDAPPYLVRNCLLEEIPQALGLGNDLFGLASSSFNDDGAHLWPTKLDYLMLRLLYAPEMKSGLSLPAARARARALLARLNPQGEQAPPLPSLHRRDLGDWPDLMRAIFSRRASPEQRQRFVEKALAEVTARAPYSPQHCYTLITAGRVFSRPEPARALALFGEAREVCYRTLGASDIRQARIALESACAHLRLGEAEEAARTAETVWPTLAAHGQDERLAALYTIGADALAVIAPGSPRAIAMERLARAWNDYAMGPGGRAADCRPGP